MCRLSPLLIGLLLALSACGGGGEEIQAVTDDMSCEEVAAVIDEAIERGTTYVGLEQDDTLLAGDLVFALSGAEARPECIDDDVRQRAAGLRSTINGIGQ